MQSKNIINSFFILIIFLIIFSNITLNLNNINAPIPNEEKEFLTENNNFHYNKNSIFSWPIFGYNTISSYFGKRTAPANGASTYHSGIDIPAPIGTNIYSICNRKSYLYWIFTVLMDIQL